MTAVTVGQLVLPYAPTSVQWGYTLNLNSTDTLGGRVLQVLSVNINSVTLQGSCGGINTVDNAQSGRTKLLSLYNTVNVIMNYHADTQNPVLFSYPDKGWSMNVYITSLPAMGWSFNTVEYTYQLTMAVDEDLSPNATKISSTLLALAQQEFANIGPGAIGYDPAWTGEGTVPNATGTLPSSTTTNSANSTSSPSSTSLLNAANAALNLSQLAN